jgi:nicotinamidase/pyrazinamidase
VFLKQHRIEKLYIAGLVTDYCVKYSALDAMRHGYDTTVILDACRGIDVIPGDVQRAIEEMQRAGVDIITSDQV